MKHAILVTAYKKVDHLIRLVKALNDDDFLFYIHIDKKSSIAEADIERVKAIKQVKLIDKKYDINWGSYNHLKAFLYLAGEAVKNNQVSYLHAVTGQDFPVKSCKQIKDFFEQNKGTEYLDNNPFPVKGWPGGGLDRIIYHNMYDKLNPSSNYQGKLIKLLIDVQKTFKIKRKLPISLSMLYGGSTYWTLTRECILYVFDYMQANPAFAKMFENSFCAEEIFFQTIVMNSPFKGNVINNHLRYINWEYKNGSMPAILDDDDFDAIIKSDAIFARKFDSPVSDHLFEKINSYIK